MHYAIVTLRTTGLLPETEDRAVEVAVVGLAHDGSIEGEWSSVLRGDTPRPLPRGITAVDQAAAPTFADAAATLMDQLRGRAILAFDAELVRRTLHAEFERAGYEVEVPAPLDVRTHAINKLGVAGLDASLRRLGVMPPEHVTALDEARGIAVIGQMLVRALHSSAAWGLECSRSARVEWPHAFTHPDHDPGVTRRHVALAQRGWLDEFATLLVDPNLPARSVDYLACLARALCEGTLGRGSADDARTLARYLGLSVTAVHAAHAALLDGVHAAIERCGTPPDDAIPAVAALLATVRFDEHEGAHTWPEVLGVEWGDLGVEHVDLVPVAGAEGPVNGVTDPAQPTDPVDRAQPAEPADPTEPVDRAGRRIGGLLQPQTLTLTQSGVTLTVTAKTVVNHAMAHNRVPLVHEVRATGLPAGVTDVRVRITLWDRDTTLTLPFETHLATGAAGDCVVRDPRVQLDASRLADIEERRPGRLDVHLFDATTPPAAGEAADPAPLASGSLDLDVLAGGQWMFDPEHSHLSYELLAAHVMPNDPALAGVLAEARERLARTTGSGATSGYQSEPERVDQVVEAIYETLRARGLEYSNPPAGWDTYGQKVRTPGEVLGQRVGTCLDTTLLLAAALEHASLNTVIVLSNRHAQLCYFRRESSLDVTVGDDLGMLRNALDIGLLRGLETTALTRRDKAAAFANRDFHARAVAAHLSGTTLGPDAAGPGLSATPADTVLDLYQLRLSGVLPLPAVTRDETGAVSVSTYVPQAYLATDHDPGGGARATRAGQGERASVPPRVHLWKNTLLDLSLRNRLIHFSERAAITLGTAPGLLVALEQRLAAERGVSLRAADDLGTLERERGIESVLDLPPEFRRQAFDQNASVYTNLTRARMITALRQLAYRARTVHEETGANNLYLALGTLHWRFEGRDLVSPLALVPVDLSGDRDRFTITLDAADALTPNYCLLEKLQHEFNLRVPEFESALAAETPELDAAFAALRVALVQHGLAGFVEESAHLAILQFDKYRLWRDLEDHWEQLAAAPLVRHLIETPTEPFDDPAPPAQPTPAELDELDATCPIPADASQLDAIAAAVQGNSFVLEGPPGTGKSQTITNLLTRALATGKTVLFVAEKRAALEVVSSRLEAVGLGVFALDLHDKNANPAAVRRQVKAALEHAVQLDADDLHVQGELLRGARGQLAAYAQGLHSTNGAGLSLYSARTRALAYEGQAGPAEPLPVDPAWVAAADSEQVRGLRSRLASLHEVAYRARPEPGHPWGFVRHPGALPAAIVGAAQRVTVALAQVTPGIFRTPAGTFGTARHLAALLAVARGSEPACAAVAAAGTPRWEAACREYLGTVGEFVARPRAWRDLVQPQVLDLPLDLVHANVAAAKASGWFGRKRRLVEAFAPAAKYLLPGVDVRPGDLPALVDALVADRETMLALAPDQAAGLHLSAIPGWNPFDAASQRHVLDETEALRALAAVRGDAHPFTALLGTGPEAVLSLRAALEPLSAVEVSALAEVRSALLDLESLSPHGAEAFARWVGEGSLFELWQGTEMARSAGGEQSLGAWLELVDLASALAAATGPEGAEWLLTGALPPAAAVTAFDQGLALASGRERAQAFGAARFDARAHTELVGQFTSSLDALRSHLRAAVPGEILRARPFTAETARGRLGLLQREVNKQRSGVKVRALMEQFGDLITQIMPCVLVSPDSVARFFPVGSQTFDIVVFDEASQIRVADSISALGRARSAVIVGDSRQMPPASFGETVFDAESMEFDEGMVVPDEESILTEAVQARVRRRWLTWHYRSRSEDLIAFSNAMYYENRLASFPAALPPRAADLGVHLVRVDGTFIRETGTGHRTNPEEARAIVAEVRRLFAASPAELPSIGIVTFNAQQRSLIESLLLDAGDERILDALAQRGGEGLFVKNLENVQGDERDVILFSVAFSKRANGTLPLQFGPLNYLGGERRLNVAITRARKLVRLFCSFDPEDLRTAETGSVGVHHLRAYLEVARGGADVLRDSGHVNVVRDRHRDEVAARVRAAGLDVATDVGLSSFRVDLALLGDDGAPLVGVLLDGPEWAARRTTGDRDALPEAVLRRIMGWPRIERVWLPEWLKAPDAVVARLREAHAAVMAGGAEVAEIAVVEGAAVAGPQSDALPDSEPGAQPNSRPDSEPDSQSDSQSDAQPPLEPEAESESQPDAQPGPVVHRSGDATRAEFTPFEVTVRGGPTRVKDIARHPRNAQSVRGVIAEILAVESPVHEVRLAKLVGACFGVQRVVESRRREIIGQVPPEQLDAHRFVWAADAAHDAPVPARPASADFKRPIEQIHPSELISSVVSTVLGAWGLAEGDLPAAALKPFKITPRSAGAAAAVDEAIARALDLGLVERRDETVLPTRAGQQFFDRLHGAREAS